MLTLGAKVGRAAAEHDALDRSFAADTGLAFSAVDAMEQLESSFFAVGIHIVAQGTAAVVDGPAQNELDGAVEANDLLALEAIGGDGGVNPAVENGFIGGAVAAAGGEA